LADMHEIGGVLFSAKGYNLIERGEAFGRCNWRDDRQEMTYEH